jgi:hypothetical protein
MGGALTVHKFEDLNIIRLDQSLSAKAVVPAEVFHQV